MRREMLETHRSRQSTKDLRDVKIFNLLMITENDTASHIPLIGKISLQFTLLYSEDIQYRFYCRFGIKVSSVKYFGETDGIQDICLVTEHESRDRELILR